MVDKIRALVLTSSSDISKLEEENLNPITSTLAFSLNLNYYRDLGIMIYIY
jgi:hypothetical protein